MWRRRLMIGAVALAMLTPMPFAFARGLNDAVGGALGGVAGAVVGDAVGGHTGEVVGAGLGGAAGVVLAAELGHDTHHDYGDHRDHSGHPPPRHEHGHGHGDRH